VNPVTSEHILGAISHLELLSFEFGHQVCDFHIVNVLKRVKQTCNTGPFNKVPVLFVARRFRQFYHF
jgi:hypothetical protein